MARGRPKKADPKSKYVRIRMTEEEYGKIRTQAEERGCTMSDIIREGIGNFLNGKVRLIFVLNAGPTNLGSIFLKIAKKVNPIMEYN